jgi:hypothetical protein
MGMEVWVSAYITLAVDEVESSVSLPCRFAPREAVPGTQRGDGVDPGAGLDDVKKRKSLAPTGNRAIIK